MTRISNGHTIAAMMTSDERVGRLRGEKVVLRQKELKDAPRDFDWAGDHELMRLDAAEPCEMAFSAYLSVYHEAIRDPIKEQFAIEDLKGKHIGNCVCYNIDEIHKEAELGILIGDREYWGKGYGTDAVKTLMQYVFNDLGIERLFLHTLEWNIRAQECFERCGFTECGRIVRKGQEFIEMEAVAR